MSGLESSAAATQSYVAGEILVQFAPGVGAQGISQAISAIGGQLAEYVRGSGAPQGALTRIELSHGLDVSSAANILSRLPGVTLAEPNYILTVQSTPTETSYTGGSLWGMEGDGTTPANKFGSQAGEAWAAGHTGDAHVAVGIVDTGVDYTHPDLYQNIWLNARELPASVGLTDQDGDGVMTFRDLNQGSNLGKIADSNANGYIDGADVLKALSDGVDQDGNGKVDDLIGWDFVNNDNNPYDDNSHGTHVAGTIGATANNGGVVGVNWAIQMLPLKFLNSTGSGTVADAIKALDYLSAVQSAQASVADPAARVDVVASNNSWGGDAFSQLMLDAIVRGAQQQILFVAAAGNGNVFGIGQNNDATAFYPSNYSTLAGAGYEAVVSVAAIDSTGAKASFSNYGANTVDLGAAGVSILSDLPGGGTGTKSGTSMATPLVTGAIALYASEVGAGASAAAIRQMLLATTAPTASLLDKVLSDGRLDVGRLLATTDTIATGATASVASAYDNEGASVGARSTGESTDDASPLIQGTLSQSGTDLAVLVYRDGAPVGLASVSGTTWTFQETGLTGAHSWQAAAIDRTGMSSPSGTFALNIAPLNAIYGTSASETVVGTANADKIWGVSKAATDLGRGAVDNLIGNAGADIFVLGDARGVFYDDGRSKSAGTGDYARINDFAQGSDKIQVHGVDAQYVLHSLTLNSQTGSGIYFDTNGSGTWDSRDELIGFTPNVTLTKGDFIFA